MLFLKQGAPLRRVQGALISDEAINELVERKALPGVRAGVYDYTWMLRGPATATATASTQTAPPPLIPVPGRTRTQGNTTQVAAAANTGATVTVAPVLTEPKPEAEATKPNVQGLPTPAPASPSSATVERHLDSLVVNTKTVHILPASPVPAPASSDLAPASAAGLVKTEKVSEVAVAVAVAAKPDAGSGNGTDITSDPTSSSTKQVRPTTPGSVVRKKATTAASAGGSKGVTSPNPKEVELEMLVEQLRVELAKITGERDAALAKLSTTEQAYKLLGEAYRDISQENEEWQKKSAAAVGTLEHSLAEKEQLITQLREELAQLKTKPHAQTSAVAAAQAEASKPQTRTTVGNVTGNVLDLLTAPERNRHKLLSQKIAKMPGQDKRVLAALVDQYELNPGTYLTIAQLANLIGVSFDTVYCKPPLGLVRLEIVERTKAQGHHYYRLNFPTFVRDYFPTLAGDKSSVADKAALVRKFVGG